LVLSLVGFFLVGIPAVVGVILGFVARSQISKSGGTQKGAGLALAGIIVGIVIVILGILAVVVLATHPGCSSTNRKAC
jgi:uncharacterized membrane protein